jgi:hypothetical protein
MNNGSSSPHEVEITRGLFVSAVTGLANAILIFVPLPEETKMTLLASLSPTLVIIASTIFALYDSWYEKLTK